ncbi:unnamed protein product [Mesocestoides corti]|uniref:Uncharacterized protein n=2 Tax=Mesocestoides corti TaxID=53468 RepID=A0A0R3UAS2_MESCO|nr:unnamed protein product [Mesocestoides corti]
MLSKMDDGSAIGVKSVLTGTLTESVRSSSTGCTAQLQLGDHIFDLKDNVGAIAVTSFRSSGGVIDRATETTLVALQTIVKTFASALREKLLPILQERQVDLSSERDQSRTFVAAYLTTGFNRVVMQVLTVILCSDLGHMWFSIEIT